MTEYEKHELDSRLKRDRRSGRMQGLIELPLIDLQWQEFWSMILKPT
jgi:hypothetical protein